MKKNRCTKTGRTDGRPLELLREFNGAAQVVATQSPGPFQGYATVFDLPIEGLGGPEERVAPGKYSVRVRGFSYRGKIYKEYEKVY